jgi:cobalt/nickel transport system ATP-binding protein
MDMTIIEVRNLSYSYQDGQMALHDVTFSLEENDSLAIIGPNGAGKSTLLHILVGLLKPQQGEILLAGLRVEERHLRAIRRTAGLVFQNPDDQLFCPTVFDDVAFGPMNLGLADDQVKQAVTESLRMVGLPSFESRSPHRLSEGEKKRIALASILSTSPQVLLLDEPTSGLDPGTRYELTGLLKRLPGAKLIVTHDLELAGELAMQVMIMNKGGIKAFGEAEKLLADRNLLARNRLARPQEYTDPVEDYRKLRQDGPPVAVKSGRA